MRYVCAIISSSAVPMNNASRFFVFGCERVRVHLRFRNITGFFSLVGVSLITILSSKINTSLYHITRQVRIVMMQSTEKKIKIIRDKLSRIGIGEKSLDDEAILASYSINNCGNLCPAPRISKIL